MKIIRDLLPILAALIDANFQSYGDDAIHEDTYENREPQIPIKQFKDDGMYVLAGDKSTFKTSLLIELTLEAALKNEMPAIIFSQKNSMIEVAYRLLARAANLPLEKLKAGRLAEEDWKLLTDGLELLVDANIYIDDYPLDEVAIIQNISLVKLIHNRVGIILFDEI